MKRNFIKFTGIALVSALALSACKKEAVKEEPFLAAILSLAVKSAASGNCAISINNAGLHYGAIITTAVLNGGSASGVYGNAALNGSTTTFTQTEFEGALGTTVTALGYASYATVPYNIKYDAFFKWDATKRNAALAWTKTFRDYFLFVGNLAISDNTGAAAAFPAAGSTGATVVSLVASGGNATACNTFANYVGACAAATTSLAASFGVVDRTNGTATLTCAKIPRSSCSVSALTTASKTTGVTNQTAVYNSLVTNSDCKNTGNNFTTIVSRVAFKGLPNAEPVTLSTGSYANSLTNLSTSSIDSTTKILPENAYPKFGALVSLGFGSLMPINKTSSKYPVDTASGSPTPFYGGVNMAATAVDSCESLGLNTGVTTSLSETQLLTPPAEIVYSFSTNGQAAALYADITRTTNVRTGAADITVGSGTGTGAQFDNYAFTRPVQGVDDNACNTSFRAKTSIPLALGTGGKLPVINVNSGDGSATSLLSICVYGGTNAAARSYAKALLASGLTNAKSYGTVTAAQIPDCGGANGDYKATAFAASNNFGELAKATTATSYPNNGE